MKHLAWLLLLVPLGLRAQIYENAKYGFSLHYAPDVWEIAASPVKGSVCEFHAGRKGAAEAKIVVQTIPVPDAESRWSTTELKEQLLARFRQAWGARYQLLSAEPWQVAPYEGNLLDYYLKVPPAAHTRVRLLLIRRGRLYYYLSYTCKEAADAKFGASATKVLTSLAFQNSLNPLLVPPAPVPPPLVRAGQQPATTAGSSVFGDKRMAATGLSGNVYALPITTVRLPAFDDLTPLGTIYAQRIDIPVRTWEEGFPGITSQFEWFGIVYTGIMEPKTSGSYTFRLVSDDGARLFIDDRLVIDNDGIHPSSSATGQLTLDASQHTIRLEYFQGPRYEIALQLFAKLGEAGEAIFPGRLFTVRPVDAPALPAPPAAAPQAVWRGRILDESTGSPLPQATLQPMPPEPAVAVDAAASFEWRGVPGRTYGYEVRQAGYYTVHDSWRAGFADRQQDIVLRKIRVGSTVLLEKVQFQQGRTVMLPGAEDALRNLLTLLREHPTMTIELAGHTDNVGPADKNLQLSEARVAIVKAYLVRQGIAAARIVGRGYGGTRPRASNDQEATRRLNRRVEFTITGLE